MSNETPITVADLPLLPDYSSDDFELIGRGSDLYKRSIAMNPTVVQLADIMQRMTYQESELNQVQALIASDVGHEAVASDLQAQVLRVDANFNSIAALQNRVGVLEAQPDPVDSGHTEFLAGDDVSGLEYTRIKFGEGFSLSRVTDGSGDNVGTLEYSAAEDVEPELATFLDNQQDPIVPQPAPVTRLRTYVWEFSGDSGSTMSVPLRLHPNVFICSVSVVKTIARTEGTEHLEVNSEFLYEEAFGSITVAKATSDLDGYVVINLAGRIV